jgi:hypothetical protein
MALFPRTSMTGLVSSMWFCARGAASAALAGPPPYSLAIASRPMAIVPSTSSIASAVKYSDSSWAFPCARS